LDEAYQNATEGCRLVETLGLELSNLECETGTPERRASLHRGNRFSEALTARLSVAREAATADTVSGEDRDLLPTGVGHGHFGAPAARAPLAGELGAAQLARYFAHRVATLSLPARRCME
jgi:hypothetical protein